MDNSPPPYELEWFEIELLREDRFALAHEESQAEWVDCDLANLTSRTRASEQPVRMPPLFVSRSKPPPSSLTCVPPPPPAPPRRTLSFHERPKPVWSVDAYRGQIISLSNTRRGREAPQIPVPIALPIAPKNAEQMENSFPRIMIIDSKRRSLVRALTAASVLGVALSFVLAAINAHGATETETATSTNAIANNTNAPIAPIVETISNAPAQASQTSSALVFSTRPVSYEALQVNGSKSKLANSSNAANAASAANAIGAKPRFSVTRRPPPRAHQDAAPSTRGGASNVTSSDDTAAMLRAAKSQTETSLN